MRRYFSIGTPARDGLLVAILLIIIATIQVTCANDNFSSNKESRVKNLYGLLKDFNDASKNKKASLLDDEGLRFKKGASLIDDEGLRFKKGSSLLDDEGLRFKKGSYLEDEGMRFKKMPTEHFSKIIRKSVLDGEGLRFKKGSSLLDDEGMRFRRSKDGRSKDRSEEAEMNKRYFVFYPFNYDSVERRSDRNNGNRDILEGEGMRF